MKTFKAVFSVLYLSVLVHVLQVSLTASPEFTWSNLAGGQLGTADGTGGAAQFDGPTGTAVDASGNVYVADSRNHTIRKISPRGVSCRPAATVSNQKER